MTEAASHDVRPTSDPALRLLAGVAAPLDAVRALVLARLGGRGRTLLRDRAARISVYVVVGLVVALVASVLTPLWALALGPLVLGVPHLISDLRYLVVRPALHRQRAVAVAVGVPLFFAAALGSTTLGLAAGLGAIAFTSAARWKRGVAFVAWAAVVGAAHHFPHTSTLVVVHGHNLVAIALFCAAFARTRRNGALLGLGFVVLAAAVLLGAFDSLFVASTSRVLAVARTLAPVSNPTLAVRLVVLFVFAQAVHYMVWLRLVPDEARERPGLRTFGSSLKALREDLGGPVLLLAAVFAVVVAGRAFGSLEAARALYLRGASFHGFLELAFALRLCMVGRERIVGV